MICVDLILVLWCFVICCFVGLLEFVGWWVAWFSCSLVFYARGGFLLVVFGVLGWCLRGLFCLTWCWFVCCLFCFWLVDLDML